MVNLKSFYSSKAWRELTYLLKVERGGRCERCGYRPLHFSRLIGHHKKHLTELTVGDSSIALNPDNIEIICFKCHNKEHRRFGNKQNVYIVYGSPFSGKSELVRELMQPGDIVMDIDKLWEAVTYCNDKVNSIKYNVFGLKACLMDQIKTRYGKWVDAYIIGGYPDKYERDRLAEDLNGVLIYCESTKEECIERCASSGKPAVWNDYIEGWWEKYSNHGLETNL